VAVPATQSEGVGTPGGRTRRWPTVITSLGVAIALCLTAVLFVRDRQNAAAASPAASNAARDEVAVATLLGVSRSLVVAHDLELRGILGMREISLVGFRAAVVGPLGGSLFTAPGAWTLAFGGGWACLHFATLDARRVALEVLRGVCPGTPIESTPGVSTAELRVALRHAAQLQRAALDAAFVSVALTVGARHAPAPYSLPTLASSIGRLPHARFRSEIGLGGVTIFEHGSAACLEPSAGARTVRVALGPCTL